MVARTVGFSLVTTLYGKLRKLPRVAKIGREAAQNLYTRKKMLFLRHAMQLFQRFYCFKREMAANVPQASASTFSNDRRDCLSKGR